MESEKVKEIKECLKNCINDCGATSCPYDKYEKGLKCIEDLQKDCLTLINELESENDTLHTNLCEYRKENQQLKDRIAELEKENATKTDTITDLLKKQEFYEKEKLTKFAERLKEKFYYEGRICRYIIDSDVFDEILKNS